LLVNLPVWIKVIPKVVQQNNNNNKSENTKLNFSMDFGIVSMESKTIEE
jgi:hypothetical protein